MKHSFTITIEAETFNEAGRSALAALESMDESKAKVVEFKSIPEETAKDRSVRGFERKKFIDRYGHECSIQESSLATEAAIWFGIDEAKVQVCEIGKGWKSVPLPEETLISSRMHLTIPMVKQLLPLLQGFVTTGDLRHPVTKYVRNENKEIADILERIKYFADNDGAGYSMEDVQELFRQENVQNFIKDNEK